MKVTIVCDDKFVSFNDEGYNFDFNWPEGLHAVQGESSNDFKEGLGFEWKEGVAEGFESQEFIKAVYEKWQKVKKENKPIPPTLEEGQKAGEGFVLSLSAHYRHLVSGTSDPFKLTTYEKKIQAANRIIANPENISIEDQDLLGPEAEERGMSILELAILIKQKNALFISGAGVIEAFEIKARKAINEADTLEKLEAILNEIPKQAEDEFEQWKQSNGLS